jgi:hypothetical protein
MPPCGYRTCDSGLPRQTEPSTVRASLSVRHWSSSPSHRTGSHAAAHRRVPTWWAPRTPPTRCRPAGNSQRARADPLDHRTPPHSSVTGNAFGMLLVKLLGQRARSARRLPCYDAVLSTPRGPSRLGAAREGSRYDTSRRPPHAPPCEPSVCATGGCGAYLAARSDHTAGVPATVHVAEVAAPARGQRVGGC